MEHIYYFLGILFLLFEIYYFTTLQKQYYRIQEMHFLKKTNPDLKWDDFTKEQQIQSMKIFVIGLAMALWLFTGLLTSQWIVFLIYLVFDLVILGIVRKLVGISPLRYFIMGLSTLVCIGTILFVLLNKYHLHIDVYSWILENIIK